jgi:hypothetical protein
MRDNVMVFISQKQINQAAKDIEQSAIAHIEANPQEKTTIAELQAESEKNSLFEYCVKQCSLPKGHLVISYILNTQFSTATERAKFGNRQDAAGDTLYHHAARANYVQLIYVLTAQKKIGTESKYIRFVITNKQQQTPLDICCALNKQEAFEALWSRVGKGNHAPGESLNAACQGGNVFIITHILQHPKTNAQHVFAANQLGDRETFSQEVTALLSQHSKEAPEPDTKRLRLTIDN